MATDRVDGVQPGRHASWLAALAFLFVLGVALLPRAFAGDGSKGGSLGPAPDFLQRYNPEAGLAAICREPEILGEAHGLCGFGGVRRTAQRTPAPPPLTEDIRFATEGPEPTYIETPPLDSWDIGFSQLPAAILPTAGGGTPGFAGALSVSGGGGGVGGFLLVDSGGNGNGNNPVIPFGGCDPQTEDCDGDSDSEPPGTPPVPEPSAALLFGLGFAAILRRQSTLR